MGTPDPLLDRGNAVQDYPDHDQGVGSQLAEHAHLMGNPALNASFGMGPRSDDNDDAANAANAGNATNATAQAVAEDAANRVLNDNGAANAANVADHDDGFESSGGRRKSRKNRSRRTRKRCSSRRNRKSRRSKAKMNIYWTIQYMFIVCKGDDDAYVSESHQQLQQQQAFWQSTYLCSPHRADIHCRVWELRMHP